MRIVTAAAIIHDGRLLVAKRGVGQNMEGFWELPGGKAEEGEDLRSCLVREIEEELDLRIEVDDEIGRSPIEGKLGSMTLVVFRARLIDGIPTLRVHSEIRWVLPEEASDLAFCVPDVPIIKEISEIMQMKSASIKNSLCERGGC